MEGVRLTCKFTEVAITEATSTHSQIESHVKETEVTMSRAIGAMSQRLEQELETVAFGTVVVSVQNTHAAIETLRAEIQVKLDKDCAELQQE